MARGLFCMPNCCEQVNTHGVALFRWFYFFGLAPVLWVVITYANNRLFQFVEWLWYRCGCVASLFI